MTHANSAKNTSVSAAVVQAIADQTGTRPEDLPEPLADVVDPDALDQLFQGRDTKGQVQFVYQGLHVTAEADGTVTVKPTTAVDSEQPR